MQGRESNDVDFYKAPLSPLQPELPPPLQQTTGALSIVNSDTGLLTMTCPQQSAQGQSEKCLTLQIFLIKLDNPVQRGRNRHLKVQSCSPPLKVAVMESAQIRSVPPLLYGGSGCKHCITLMRPI